jgi:hypothetical protein
MESCLVQPASSFRKVSIGEKEAFAVGILRLSRVLDTHASSAVC